MADLLMFAWRFLNSVTFWGYEEAKRALARAGST